MRSPEKLSKEEEKIRNAVLGSLGMFATGAMAVALVLSALDFVKHQDASSSHSVEEPVTPEE